MDGILVSAVVPVYQVDRQVFRACVESLTGQTEHRIEILLVFDGTMALYEDMLGLPPFQDARVRAVGREHAGASAARNAGIAQAKGEWILFADADDCLDADAVKELLALTDACPQADLAVGDYRIRYPRGVQTHAYRSEAAQFLGAEKTELLRDVLNPQTGLGFCWGKLYRTELLRERGIFFCEELVVAEDAEFVLKAAMGARGVCYLPKALYTYQVNPDSAVRKFREDYPDRYEKAMRRIRADIRDAGLERELLGAYETCVLYHLLLVTVNFSFHPKQDKSARAQIAAYKKLAAKPMYREALQKGDAGQFSLSRRISVRLIRMRLWPGIYAVARIRHRQLKF